MRPHGYKGALFVRTPTGTDSHLGKLTEIWVRKRDGTQSPHSIEEAAWMPKGWKLKLQGFDTEEAAEACRGAIILSPREKLDATDKDEFYVQDLIGCRVFLSGTNQEIGVLKSVESLAPSTVDRWWIQAEKKEYVIPSTQDFVDRIDLKTRCIWVHQVVDPESSDDEA